MVAGRCAQDVPRVGMVGAGQLARMTHQAAIGPGQSLRVLADHADDSAALVAADVVIGDYRRLEDLQAFAADCDVVTFDHEHVPGEHLRALVAAGVTVRPGPAALRHAQDKQVMRERLSSLGLPVPRWRPVRSAADVAAHAALTGWPVIVKAARGGYDGKGVWLVDDSAVAAELVELVDTGTPLLVEERVPLRRELAALVARSPFGQAAVWPVVETVQRDGVCVEVIAPAPGLGDAAALEAVQLALTVAAELDVVGVLAVELFDTPSGLLVNELAMRPHNSGHWTIEGSRTSQFDQHLRAVCDYPLGDTRMTAPYVVMANVLGAPGDEGGQLDKRLHHAYAAHPDVRIHLYGKQVRPGRKIGHVTALGDDLAEVRAGAVAAAAELRGSP